MEIIEPTFKLDKGKLAMARAQVAKDHNDMVQRAIKNTHHLAAKEAYNDLQACKEGKTKWKPLGVFSMDQVVFCQQQYGKEITRDADFWKFYRKAIGQEFLNHA